MEQKSGLEFSVDGWLHGEVDSLSGEITGDELMYIYPDMVNVLYGKFTRGNMTKAQHTTIADVGKDEIRATFNADLKSFTLFRFQQQHPRRKSKQAS